MPLHIRPSLGGPLGPRAAWIASLQRPADAIETSPHLAPDTFLGSRQVTSLGSVNVNAMMRGDVLHVGNNFIRWFLKHSEEILVTA